MGQKTKMKNRKMTPPDIGGLLGKIAEKQKSGELPKTEIQHVQPIVNTEEEFKSLNSETLKQESGQTKRMGRPSVKSQDLEYVKISPKIPKELKKQADMALVEGRFMDAQQRSITTLDELTTFALEQLLAQK